MKQCMGGGAIYFQGGVFFYVESTSWLPKIWIMPAYDGVVKPSALSWMILDEI